MIGICLVTPSHWPPRPSQIPYNRNADRCYKNNPPIVQLLGVEPEHLHSTTSSHRPSSSLRAKVLSLAFCVRVSFFMAVTLRVAGSRIRPSLADRIHLLLKSAILVNSQKIV